MRLLALLTDGFGSSGGIARYNCDLMTALSRSSFVERVLALPRFGATDSQRPDRVLQFDATASAHLWAAKAVSIALTQRADAIFCGHLNAAPFAASLARWLGKPLWIQAHGIEAWSDRGPPFRRALAKSGLVTSVSRYTRRRLLSWCDIDPDRVRVLPNTFDATYAPTPRRADLMARYGLQGRNVILTVGRMAASERYKGHDRIIRCLPMLRARGTDVAYLVAGSGDDRPRLEALAGECGVRDAIVFAGQVPDRELPDHYALADVFAMPSTGEGFGIVFLEAAASGLPVIGGNRDGSVDALADGAVGTPVDPDDLPALANALARALAAPRGRPPETLGRFGAQHFSCQVDNLVQRLRD